jgi:cytochrome c oxidase subunit 2
MVLTFTPFPVAGSEEATLVDDAFTILTILAVPIFAFVSAMLLYSMLRFRIRGEPTDDGPPVRTHRPLVYAWLLLTTALTIAVIIHPGITGIRELRTHNGKEVDLTVQVEGGRWFWRVTYPEHNVFSRRELVLPVHRVTRFEVTATDVLHSFWVPAFRVKIDAVPGMTTTVVATPHKLGSFNDDPNFRLQCAELCGAGHAVMRIPVRVVEQEEFDAWIAQQQPVRR